MSSPLTTKTAVAAPRVSPIALVTLAALVFATNWGCIVLGRQDGAMASIWVANAIVLASLLKNSRRAWPEILGVAFVSYFSADLAVGNSVMASTCIALANIVEVLAVALPLRWLGFDRVFSRTEVLITFYAMVAVACVLSAAFFGVTMHMLSGLPSMAAAKSWYYADVLGLSLLVPFFMCVKLSALKEMFRAEQAAGTIALLSSVAGVAILGYVFPLYSFSSLLFIPILLLLTFQRGCAGGATGLAVAVTISIVTVLTHHSNGTLTALAVDQQISLVQFFYAVLGFTIIMTGAALDERRKLERSLATVVKRAEASREEALLAKEVAERASTAKSTFLANMSHELRTPLNAVLGFSEMIRAEFYGPVGDKRYREYAGLIHGAGSHLLALITDILDMSKIEAGKLTLNRERIETQAVVRECVELLEERADSAGIVLVTDISIAPGTIDADRRAVKQILLNLLSNAIKFTPAGGVITVSARREDEFCAFEVRDSGVGIAAGDLNRIGNPFVQLGNNDGSKPGTGLGLALVRALAELHGGTLNIQSTEGLGTTVTVTIPLVAAAAAAA